MCKAKYAMAMRKTQGHSDGRGVGSGWSGVEDNEAEE